MSKIDLLPLESSSEQWDEEKIRRLEAIKNLPVQAGQAAIDQLFTAQRREQKLAEQEEDNQGLRVRYFRKMTFAAFVKMARKGYQDAAAYAEEETVKVNPEELKHFIINCLPFEVVDKFEVKNIKLKDLIAEHFGQNIYEKLEQSEFSYEGVMDFVNRYIPEADLKQIHTGSVGQKFSPFLSLSVGGVISTLTSEKYPYQKIYCEIVKRDIISHKTGVKGEKEVFAKKIKMSDIIGAYVDDNKIFELIRNDKTFSQGNFYNKHQAEMRFLDDAIGKWRWEVDTNDCLPNRLQS